MTAYMKSTSFKLEDVTSTVRVEEDPRSRLMYYMKCVCSVLDLSDEQMLRHMMDFGMNRQPSKSETDALLEFCRSFSPEVLVGKCIFHAEDMCGSAECRFLELSVAEETFKVTSRVIIGNETRLVTMIMIFKKTWLEKNYFRPMAAFTKCLPQGTSNRAPLVEESQQEEECPSAWVLCWPILCPFYYCCCGD